MEADGTIRLMLPDGTVIPASPENRERAERLWLTVDREVEVRINKELLTDEVKIEGTHAENLKDIDNYEKELKNQRTDNGNGNDTGTANGNGTGKRNDTATGNGTELELEREQNELLRRELAQMKLARACDAAVTMERERCRKEMDLMTERHTAALAATVTAATHTLSSTNEAILPYSSGLAISDPAVNLIDEIVNLIPLDSHLRVTKSGTATTATISDLYAQTMTTAADLKNIVVGRPVKSSLRFALEKLKNSLRSRKQMSDAVATGCMIRAIAELCPELEYRLISALKMAASMCHSDRIEVKEKVDQCGETITIGYNMLCLTVEKLPGMAELVSYDWDRLLVKSFGDLVLSYVCYESNLAEKLKLSRRLWESVKGDNEKDCERYLFAENQAFDTCTSWLGSVIVNDLDRFNHLLKNSPVAVKSAYISYLANPENDVNQNSVLTMDYDRLLKVFRKIWQMAQTTIQMTASLLQQQPTAMAPSVTNTAASWSQMAAQDVPLNPVPPLGCKASDINIRCAEHGCDDIFVFTVQQQMTNKERGYNNQPRRCPAHRRRGPCNTFSDNGSCSFGSECKFAHIGADGTLLNPIAGDTRLVSDRGADDAGMKNFPCKNFQTGTCLAGPACPFKHVLIDIVPETGFTGLAKPVVRFNP